MRLVGNVRTRTKSARYPAPVRAFSAVPLMVITFWQTVGHNRQE
jgi:hypothetical protein